MAIHNEILINKHYFENFNQYSLEMKGLTGRSSPRIARLWETITLTVGYFPLTILKNSCMFSFTQGSSQIFRLRLIWNLNFKQKIFYMSNHKRQISFIFCREVDFSFSERLENVPAVEKIIFIKMVLKSFRITIRYFSVSESFKAYGS